MTVGSKKVELILINISFLLFLLFYNKVYELRIIYYTFTILLQVGELILAVRERINALFDNRVLDTSTNASQEAVISIVSSLLNSNEN